MAITVGIIGRQNFGNVIQNHGYTLDILNKEKKLHG